MAVETMSIHLEIENAVSFSLSVDNLRVFVKSADERASPKFTETELWAWK